MPLPTESQLSIIDGQLEKAGITSPAARGLAVKAFDEGAFVVEGEDATLSSWLAVQAAENAKLFAKPTNAKANGNGADGDGEHTPKPNNPFSKAGWNLTEQGRLVRVNPKMAASLAASCNVKIGATRPNL